MKYVLVTGANGGMGKSVCALLVQNGYTVFALDIVPPESAKNVIPLQADVTDAESLGMAFETVKAQAPELSAIIHLAGIYTLDSLAEMPDEKYERTFKINVFGAFYVNKIFLPLLISGGRIIIVTSELAVRDPLPFTGIYGITKTALDKYAYSLRMELQLLDISVSVLRAGAVDTGMISSSTRQLDEFTENTKLYSCNAKRFKEIVDRVEARKIPPEKLSKKLYSILTKKRPRFAYSRNRNKLFILLDAVIVRKGQGLAAAARETHDGHPSDPLGIRFGCCHHTILPRFCQQDRDKKLRTGALDTGLHS